LIQRAWRLCKRKHAGHAFDGEGARQTGGRWNQPGVAVVYTSATLSLAAMEALVHVDVDDAPQDLIAISVDIPEGLAVRRVEVTGLPEDWRSFPAPPALRDLGSAWARALDTAVLSVPSAVIPQERNFVLNPGHRDFKRLVIGRPEPFSFDPRLLR
jgi:RES domain-containing protein